MRSVDLRLGPNPIGLAERVEFSIALNAYESHFSPEHDSDWCDETCDFYIDLHEAQGACFNSTWSQSKRGWRYRAMIERLTFVKR